MRFKDYPYLKKVVIPNSVSLTNTDFTLLFSSLRRLVEVHLPNSVTNINITFAGCSNLTTVVIEGKPTSMQQAFNGCVRLSKVYILDEDVSPEGAFINCSTANLELHIYVPKESNTLSNILSKSGIFGYTSLSFEEHGPTESDPAALVYYYATESGRALYIHPVDDVEATRIANGD